MARKIDFCIGEVDTRAKRQDYHSCVRANYYTHTKMPNVHTPKEKQGKFDVQDRINQIAKHDREVIISLDGGDKKTDKEDLVQVLKMALAIKDGGNPQENNDGRKDYMALVNVAIARNAHAWVTYGSHAQRQVCRDELPGFAYEALRTEQGIQLTPYTCKAGIQCQRTSMKKIGKDDTAGKRIIQEVTVIMSKFMLAVNMHMYDYRHDVERAAKVIPAGVIAIALNSSTANRLMRLEEAILFAQTMHEKKYVDMKGEMLMPMGTKASSTMLMDAHRKLFGEEEEMANKVLLIQTQTNVPAIKAPHSAPPSAPSSSAAAQQPGPSVEVYDNGEVNWGQTQTFVHRSGVEGEVDKPFMIDDRYYVVDATGKWWKQFGGKWVADADE